MGERWLAHSPWVSLREGQGSRGSTGHFRTKILLGHLVEFSLYLGLPKCMLINEKLLSFQSRHSFMPEKLTIRAFCKSFMLPTQMPN